MDKYLNEDEQLRELVNVLAENLVSLKEDKFYRMNSELNRNTEEVAYYDERIELEQDAIIDCLRLIKRYL